jgi:lysophospholipase L1-like esterase
MVGATLCVPFAEGDESAFQRGEVARWRGVARRPVYFGHQSVGEDITSGLAALNDELDLGLRIVLTRVPSAVSHPAFVHFHAGRNQDPASKNADLLKILAARPRPDHPIVLLKYCYVDVDRSTNVAAMFASYVAMVETIRAQYPDVTIIHATVPLTTVETPVKARVKQLLGRHTAREDAIARQRYNALIRVALAGREPLFDIARLEAGRPDGARATYSLGDQKIEVLAEENTRDGGHLNQHGQKLVARELLNLLAKTIEGGR